MSDDFQALPPADQHAREPLPAYDRLGEVNLRKPDRICSWNLRWLVALTRSWNLWWLVALTAIVAFAYVVLLDFSAQKRVTPSSSPVVLSDDFPEIDVDVVALQGVWTANGAIVDGKKEAGEVKVTFRNKRFVMTFAGKTYQGVLEPEPARVLFTGDTYRLDFVVLDKPQFYAIYRIKDVGVALVPHEHAGLQATMTLCLSPEGGTRPDDFTADKGSGRTLLVLKRQSSLREDENCHV